jgi:hypothetical protein
VRPHRRRVLTARESGGRTTPGPPGAAGGDQPAQLRVALGQLVGVQVDVAEHQPGGDRARGVPADLRHLEAEPRTLVDFQDRDGGLERSVRSGPDRVAAEAPRRFDPPGRGRVGFLLGMELRGVLAREVEVAGRLVQRPALLAPVVAQTAAKASQQKTATPGKGFAAGVADGATTEVVECGAERRCGWGGGPRPATPTTAVLHTALHNRDFAPEASTRRSEAQQRRQALPFSNTGGEPGKVVRQDPGGLALRSRNQARSAPAARLPGRRAPRRPAATARCRSGPGTQRRRGENAASMTREGL